MQLDFQYRNTDPSSVYVHAKNQWLFSHNIYSMSGMLCPPSLYINTKLVLSCVGDLSAEDPVHGLVYGPHAEPLSQPAAVVLRLHALRRRNARPVDACRGHKSSGEGEFKRYETWLITVYALRLVVSWIWLCSVFKV